jgi:uncharacterized membrane protein
MSPALFTLTFAAPQWLWPAAGLLLLVTGTALWSYRAAPRGPWRGLCAGLKLLGGAALAACLLEPLWTGQRARPGANLLAVVADNSQGLQVRDRGAGQTRGELLRAWLDPGRERAWAELEETFELRRFTFDARLQPVRDFGELTFAGHASALGAALTALRERFAHRPLAGVLLFTDGIATDLPEGLPSLEGLPPVYPVVVGRPGTVRDLALGAVQVTQTAFEDAPVTLGAEVQASGVAGERVQVSLLDARGTVLQTQEARARRDKEPLSFRFQWRPPQPGLAFYEVRASLAGAAPAAEATLLNNTRLVPVDRGGGPYRILYVSGRPNWEYKFLNRALAEDDQLQLVALQRVARREPKFEFRGRAGETSNPLFRGFGEQAPEEVARYDQPVLIRLNTRDELELRGGFPRAAAELYAYDALILDDVEAEFFSADQQSLIARFVSERGGGLLMLGGAECFRQGGYARTPVGDALPVYLDRAPEPAPDAAWRFQLTREGWLEPWVRLHETEAAEKARLQAMPAFAVLNPVGDPKPGASLLATVTDARGRELPALVTQRFGRGRAAAFTVGDFWRWGMLSPEARRDLEKAWRQMARWLVAEVPRRVELAVQPAPEQAPGAVRLQVRARDPQFQPLDEAQVSVEVAAVAAGTNAPAPPLRLRAEPSPREAGLYEALYVARQPGGYRATVTVTNAAGEAVGRAEAGWSSDLAAEEFRSLEPNVALLEELARRTGGEVVPAARLAEFARGLPRRQAPVMEAWTTPAWHTPGWFALALACFLIEWGVRRWKGLP